MSILSYASEGTTKIGAGVPRRSLKHVAVALAITVAGVAVADLAYDYLTVGRYLETTDDAYVKADIDHRRAEGRRAISPRSWSATTSAVKAGQVLARIDDRDFRTALDQAKADVAGVRGRASRNLRCPDRRCSSR